MTTDAADAAHLVGGTPLLTLIQGTAGVGMVELVIAAWLHAKEQTSQSVKTRATYEAILAEFRQVLQAEGLDLNVTDPRRVRDRLAYGRDGERIGGVGGQLPVAAGR